MRELPIKRERERGSIWRFPILSKRKCPGGEGGGKGGSCLGRMGRMGVSGKRWRKEVEMGRVGRRVEQRNGLMNGNQNQRTNQPTS